MGSPNLSLRRPSRRTTHRVEALQEPPVHASRSVITARGREHHPWEHDEEGDWFCFHDRQHEQSTFPKPVH